MDETAYRAALRATLDALDGPALERIRALLAALPEAAREIHVVVFPDQDGEGAFSVHVSLDGLDLYVLNRAIEPHRTLFEVIHGEEGFEPDLPMFGRDPGFSVQDAIVDTAADWIEALWPRAGRAPVPVMIYGDEDYGSAAPRRLEP